MAKVSQLGVIDKTVFLRLSWSARHVIFFCWLTTLTDINLNWNSGGCRGWSRRLGWGNGLGVGAG